MAIRIGPDKALGGKAKPSENQAQQRAQGAGQRAATRRTEQRRDRETEDDRRDAEDRARDAVAKASDDVEDLGDFGDVDDDESDGAEYGMNDDDRDDLGLGPGDTEQAPARPTSRPDPTSDGGLNNDDRDDLGLGPGDTEQAPSFPTSLTDPPEASGGLTDADLGPTAAAAPSTARPSRAAPRDRPADTGAANLDGVQPFGGPQQAMAQGTAYDGMDVLEGPQQGQAAGRVYLGQPDRPAETGLLDVGGDEPQQEQAADPPQETFAERRRAALLDRFEDVPQRRAELVDSAGRYLKAGRDRAEAKAVELGQNIEAVHTDAWGFYDSARGALDDDYAPPEESAIERSFAAVPTIEEVYRYGNPHAGNNLFETAGQVPVVGRYLGKGASVVGDTNVLSLVPGQDFDRVTQDGNIEGRDEWLTAGASVADFLPWGGAVGAVAKGARAVAPTKLGGAFLESTTPWAHVPRLPTATPEAVQRALKAEQQLAETGSASFELGGKVMEVKQTPLDRVLREAQDKPVTLSSHATPDIDFWLKGGELPPNPGKSAIESGQFRTLGGQGVPHFTHQSATGVTGKHGCLAVYSDPIEKLATPGAGITPLGKKSYRGGLEMERILPVGDELQPLKRATGLGEQGLYLAEDLNAPSYGARVGANIEALGQRLKRSGPELRVADPDELARVRYDKALDDLTPSERAYVDMAQQSDDAVSRAAGRGDSAADEILQGRQEVARVKRGVDDARTPRGDADPRHRWTLSRPAC